MVQPPARCDITPAYTAPTTMLSPTLIEASAAVRASIRVLLPIVSSYLNCLLSPSVQSMHLQAPSMPINWFQVDAPVATSRKCTSSERDTFPQNTQIAACCTFGTHGALWNLSFGVLAPYLKRAMFQRQQRYFWWISALLRQSDPWMIG
jgi:hypothetical protein